MTEPLKRALVNLAMNWYVVRLEYPDASEAKFDYLVDRLLARIAEGDDQSVLDAMRLVKPMSNPEARVALAAAMRAISNPGAAGGVDGP